MDFVPGNRAIRHHALDGKDIHLFQALDRGEGYRYLGRFACSTWELRRGTDLCGDERRVIVLRLIQPEDDDEPIGPTSRPTSLDQLRHHALDAASDAGERNPREARRLYHERSSAVRECFRRAASSPA
jgi:5-methylcytosine-specific restriction enzyme A